MAKQIFARQFRQQDFRTSGGAAHQLTAIELHEILAVVFMQRETPAIGCGRFGQSVERFHGSILAGSESRVDAITTLFYFAIVRAGVVFIAEKNETAPGLEITSA